MRQGPASRPILAEPGPRQDRGDEAAHDTDPHQHHDRFSGRGLAADLGIVAGDLRPASAPHCSRRFDDTSDHR